VARKEFVGRMADEKCECALKMLAVAVAWLVVGLMAAVAATVAGAREGECGVRSHLCHYLRNAASSALSFRRGDAIISRELIPPLLCSKLVSPDEWAHLPPPPSPDPVINALD
jgi:hypothetical protein